MKKVILLIALTTAVAGVMAQGVVNFANKVASATPALNALVTENNAAGAKLSDNYVAALLWGAAADSSLTPALQGGVLVTKTFIKSSSTQLGTGVFSTGSTLVIDGTQVGQKIYVQVVAWESAMGATPAAAYAAYAAGNGKMGWSSAFQVSLGGDTLPPTVLSGLTPFSVAAIPEPTVLALGVLGGVAFLLRRRS